jgi:hypothetical protein
LCHTKEEEHSPTRRTARQGGASVVHTHPWRRKVKVEASTLEDTILEKHSKEGVGGLFSSSGATRLGARSHHLLHHFI